MKNKKGTSNWLIRSVVEYVKLKYHSQNAILCTHMGHQRTHVLKVQVSLSVNLQSYSHVVYLCANDKVFFESNFQLSTDSTGSVIGTVTSFCVSCVLGRIWKEKASCFVARTVFPIRLSLSHDALALSCVSCVPWLVVLPPVPVVCVPAVGS